MTQFCYPPYCQTAQDIYGFEVMHPKRSILLSQGKYVLDLHDEIGI